MTAEGLRAIAAYSSAELAAGRQERAAYASNRAYKAARSAYDRQRTTDHRAILSLATHELKFHQKRLARLRRERDRREEHARHHLQPAQRSVY